MNFTNRFSLISLLFCKLRHHFQWTWTFCKQWNDKTKSVDGFVFSRWLLGSMKSRNLLSCPRCTAFPLTCCCHLLGGTQQKPRSLFEPSPGLIPNRTFETFGSVPLCVTFTNIRFHASWNIGIVGKYPAKCSTFTVLWRSCHNNKTKKTSKTKKVHFWKLSVETSGLKLSLPSVSQTFPRLPNDTGMQSSVILQHWTSFNSRLDCRTQNGFKSATQGHDYSTDTCQRGS